MSSLVTDIELLRQQCDGKYRHAWRDITCAQDENRVRLCLVCGKKQTAPIRLRYYAGRECEPYAEIMLPNEWKDETQEPTQ